MFDLVESNKLWCVTAILRQKQNAPPKKKKTNEFKANSSGAIGKLTDASSLTHLKLTFPSLKGGDAVEWFRDCEEYFSIFKVSENRRPAIATMHMNGTPRYWYKSFMVGRSKVSWQHFSQAFLDRFGEVETKLVFDKFKKLQQVSTVEFYFDEFERCRGQLLSKIPSLTQEYFLENLIGSLQSEIKAMIRLLEPTTLEQALNLARFYEQSQHSQSRKGGNYKSNFNSQASQKFTAEALITTLNLHWLLQPRMQRL